MSALCQAESDVWCGTEEFTLKRRLRNTASAAVVRSSAPRLASDKRLVNTDAGRRWPLRMPNGGSRSRPSEILACMSKGLHAQPSAATNLRRHLVETTDGPRKLAKRNDAAARTRAVFWPDGLSLQQLTDSTLW